MLSQDSIGDLYRIMKDRTIKDGYIPNIVKTVEDIETEIFSVITENLIGFVPENFSLPDCSKFIKKISILNSHHTFDIEAAYLDSNRNNSLVKFLKRI